MNPGRSAKRFDIGPRQSYIPVDQAHIRRSARPGFEPDGTGAAKEIEKPSAFDQSPMVQDIEKRLAGAISGRADRTIGWAKEALAA